MRTLLFRPDGDISGGQAGQPAGAQNTGNADAGAGAQGAAQPGAGGANPTQGAFSDYLEAALLNATLRNLAYTSPVTVYLALFTVAPTDAGGGTEVSGGGYARQAIAFNAPSGGTCTNSADVNFPQATADWGSIVAFGIFDAATLGNLLYYGNFNVAKTVLTGDYFAVPAGQLSITLD